MSQSGGRTRPKDPRFYVRMSNAEARIQVRKFFDSTVDSGNSELGFVTNFVY